LRQINLINQINKVKSAIAEQLHVLPQEFHIAN
jgi:hypothetical protein